MNDDVWVVQWGLLKLSVKRYDVVKNDVKKYTFSRKYEITKKENTHIDISELLQLFDGRDEVINATSECNNSEIWRIAPSLAYRNDDNPSMYIDLLKPIYLKISSKEILEREIIYLLKEKIEYSSDFNVFYNGYFYLIYWKQNIKSPIFMQGAHVRNILEETFALSNKYETEPVPPTPFRKEICFNFYHENNIEDYEIKSKEKVGSHEIISVNLPQNKNEQDFFKKLNTLIQNDFRTYFDLLERKNEIERRVENLYEKMTQQTEICNQFQRTGVYHILKRRGLKNQMKQNMTELFRDYSEYFLNYSSYQRKKEELLEEFPNNSYLNSHYNQYVKELGTESCNFELISSLINYSKDTLAISEGNYIHVFGIIVGGIITLISVYVGSLL